MAGKRLVMYIIFLAAVLTAAALLYTRIREMRARQKIIDDQRFINTYVDLTIARGVSGSDDPDSLAAVFDSVFAENQTDSLWMRRYLKEIGEDLKRYQRVWSEILDSLSDSKLKAGN